MNGLWDDGWTDHGPRTDGQGRLLRTTLGKPGVQNRGLVPTTQPEPDFSCTYVFHELLDNVKLIISQKMLMTGCRDMGKKLENCQFGFSPNLRPRTFFFKNQALSIMYPYGVLTSCKKIKKKLLDRFWHIYRLTYRPTDGQTTDFG